MKLSDNLCSFVLANQSRLQNTTPPERVKVMPPAKRVILRYEYCVPPAIAGITQQRRAGIKVP
ncbi:MAG TPA: hypothetical protein PKC39_05585 [Ferruginibacter sp.]|nr:hypothetical protein [Ferruginibacter sp.]HMP20413.1 hypothetical protein [Ferruginibacter sp.]